MQMSSDIAFNKQLKREMSLVRKVNDHDPNDFKYKIPASKSLKLTLTDAMELALRNNQDAIQAVASYKQSLLSYQSTLFEFQFGRKP